MDVAQKTAGNGAKSRPESRPESGAKSRPESGAKLGPGAKFRSKSGAKRGPGPNPRTRRVVQARCPLRYGEPCTLCQPGAHGPEDCQTVAMVMADPDLREMMVEMNREHRKNSAGGLATR